MLSNSADFDFATTTKWQEERISPVLSRLVKLQRPDGSWGDQDEAAEVTPLFLLGFLGMGYEHKTQGPYRQTIKRGVQRLLDTRGDSASTRIMALRTMALCEAYAMTADTALRDPCQQGVASLLADRTADGGWSHPVAHGPRHWPTTTLAIMALKSAQAGGLATPIKELGAWWPGTVGDVAVDSLDDLAWKSVAGVFLGWKAQADTALMSALLERTGKALPADPWTHYACTLTVFQSGGAAWKSWMSRSTNRPVPAQWHLT